MKKKNDYPKCWDKCLTPYCVKYEYHRRGPVVNDYGGGGIITRGNYMRHNGFHPDNCCHLNLEEAKNCLDTYLISKGYILLTEEQCAKILSIQKRQAL